jgi:hypothetical protein
MTKKESNKDILSDEIVSITAIVILGGIVITLLVKSDDFEAITGLVNYLITAILILSGAKVALHKGIFNKK